MPRAVQGSDQCKIRTASSVWEREAIYSFTPTCIQQATWRWGRDHFYFPNVKFLPSFLFSPSLPHSLPFFLLPSPSFSFSLSLPLSSSLYSSLPCLAVDAMRNFPASTKVVLSPWWIHSSMLIIFWNLAYSGLWLKGLVLRKKISTSFFQGRERGFVVSLSEADLLISHPCWLGWWSLFFWHCLSDTSSFYTHKNLQGQFLWRWSQE